MTTRKKLAFSAITVGFAALLAFGAAELYLRYRTLGSFTAVWKALAAGDAPYSNLSSRDWVVFDPELSYRLNPDQPEVNSIGIRHGEIELEKQPGRMRIIVIGDSVAWPRNGFVKLLSGKLGKRAEVINAALPGYTAHQERILLERDLAPLKPDLVIQQYCLNDNHRFLHQFNESGDMIWTEEARRALLPSNGGPLAWLPNWSYLAVRLRLLSDQWTRPKSRFPWDNALDFAPGWTDAGWDLYREEFSLMRKATETAGGRLTIIMFPFAPQFRERLLAADKDYVLKPQRIMKEICDENGVPLLDMYPILAAAGGADLQPDGIHLSDEGHRITADALYEHLVSHNLIPAATGETEDKH